MTFKSTLLVLLLIASPSISFSQKLKIYVGMVGGVELALKTHNPKNQLKNFNQNNLFFQPIGVSFLWNEKIGLHLDARVSAITNQKAGSVSLLSLESSTKKLYSYSPENRFSVAEESFRFRLGLIYQIQKANLLIKPRLLAGLEVFPREPMTGILKEQNTNFYYSASFQPNGKTTDLFASVTSGINLSKKFRRRGALNLDLSYTYSNTKMKLASEIANLYSKEVINTIIIQKAGISSISLGVGLSFIIGRESK